LPHGPRPTIHYGVDAPAVKRALTASARRLVFFIRAFFRPVLPRSRDFRA
jgi:hypothetical protein